MGLHTDEEDERAEGLSFLLVGIGEGVDRCPLYANVIEVLVDAVADREPSGPNSVTVGGASLTKGSLGLRALAYGPVRARFEETGSATAVEVVESVGVPISEAGRHGDDVT